MLTGQASNIAYSAVALLASLLLIIQLPAHFDPAKSNVWLFNLWITFQMLNTSVIAVIRVSNVNIADWAPAWCDISFYILVASGSGIQLSLLCIARRLYCAVTRKAVYQSAVEEKRGMVIDLFIAIGLPLSFMPLVYVMISGEYVVMQQVGCYPLAIRPIPAIVLQTIVPVIVAAVSAAYSALTMFIMIRHRAQMREFDGINNEVNQYERRLILLAFAQIVLILPSEIFRLVNDTDGPVIIRTWNFVQVDWSARHFLAFEWGRWMYVVYAFVFIAFFGWTERARKHYERYYISPFFAAMRLLGCLAQRPSLDAGKARTDLEFASPGHGPAVCPYTTSLNASRFSASYTATTYHIATYHTTHEEAIAGPQAPAPVHCTPTSVLHEQDLTDMDHSRSKSLQLPCGETAAPITHTSDNAPMQLIAKPEPVYHYSPTGRLASSILPESG